MLKTIAILTPTYNRIHTLPRLFQSLMDQSSYDFKWYIVDDGSTDGTDEKYKDFFNDNFEVIFIKKLNGGKHTALNVGINAIAEELTIIVDSDDYLETHAVETILEDWRTYCDKADIAGLCYYKMFDNGNIVGQRFPSGTEIDSYINLRVNKDVRGDKAEIFKTEVLRKYPFPVFEGEKFLSEAIVWSAISKAGYKLAFIDKGIYYCEYLTDGISAAGRKHQLKNPRGTMEHAKAFMHQSVKFQLRMKYMLLYSASRILAKVSIRAAWRELDGYRLLYIFWLLPGALLAVYWKKKYNL